MFAETLPIEPEEIIVFKFDMNKYNIDEAHYFFHELQRKFPNHKVLIIPDKTSLETMDLDDLIQVRDRLSETIEEWSNNDEAMA